MMFDPLILTRSVHIAATVFATGTVCFVVLIADVPALRHRLTCAVWIALAVALLSGALWLVLLAADIYGAPILDVCLHGGVWQVATDTRFGQVGSARAVLALLLGLSMLWPAARLLQLAAAAGLIALLALTGHAGATPGLAGRTHLASDMVHLLAAGAWVGGLPAFVLLLAQARRHSAPAWRGIASAATKRFSQVGMASVAALLTSGLINSWNLLGGPRDLVTTDYGRLLLIKLGLFAAMLAIAAVNLYRLTPRLAAPAAMRALQRNSLVETGLGIVVLLLVGALGTLEPSAHVHTASTEIPPDAAFVHIHSSEAMADVIIDPGRAERAKVTIRVSHDDSSEFAAKEVRLALDPQAATLKAVEHATVRMPDGTWQVDGIDIRQPGIWTVRVIVTPAAGPTIVLDAPVVIER